MSKILKIKESLDLLFVYANETHKRDLDAELKEMYKESTNRAIYTVKQWGAHNTREEILEELNRRYGELR